MARTGPAGEGGTGAAIISIDGVSKRFGRTLALDGLSLSVRPGESLALLGPNGAGKSTLIHILCTILQPDAGTVHICGHDIRRAPAKARACLGVVFQEPSLDTRLTVFENLDFHGRVYRVPRRLRRQRIDEMLETVGLTESRDRLVRALSPGMKRRVEIARAMVHDARVLVLDEPTIGLDTQSRQGIWRHLEDLRRRRDLTLIVTTHYIEEVEGCDRVCIIDGGRVHAQDTPDALRAAHGREVLRVEPRSPDAAAAILARFPQARTGAGSEILITGEGTRMTERVLAEFGDGVRYLSFERPSLESAFLNIVGRSMGDADPAPQARPGRR